jgi:hypothetical protein
MRMYLGLAAAASGCALFGCSGAHSSSTDTRFDRRKPIFATIRNADRLILYEGLPHKGYEEPEFAEATRAKQSTELHGYPFYAELLQLREDDEMRLKALLGDERSFQPYRGPKACGGFHPDYGIEWQLGGDTYRALICFGCGEAKVYGPGGGLYCDITAGAFEQIKTVLRPYRKNRPVTQYTARLFPPM